MNAPIKRTSSAATPISIASRFSSVRGSPPIPDQPPNGQRDPEHLLRHLGCFIATLTANLAPII
jgi:hypothetical protein